MAKYYLVECNEGCFVMANYAPFNPQQIWLIPPDPSERLRSDHIAFAIYAAVEHLDVTPLMKDSRDMGQEAYHPRLLLMLLLLGFAKGSRSSREMEELARTDMAGIFLCGGAIPDHSTIARFRRNSAKAIEDMFILVLMACSSAGLTDFGEVALDGTKIRSSASRRKGGPLDKLERRVGHLRQSARELMEQAEAADIEAENRASLEKAAKSKEKLAQDISAEIERLKDEAKANNRKVSADTYLNISDPDCREMKAANGLTIHGYNAQAMVDTKTGIIVAADLVQTTVDMPLGPQMLDQVLHNRAKCEATQDAQQLTIVADAGYDTRKLITHIAGKEGVVGIINYTCESSKAEYQKCNFDYDIEEDAYICPKTGTLLKRRASVKPPKGGVVYYACDFRDCPYRPDCTSQQKRKPKSTANSPSAIDGTNATPEAQPRKPRRPAVRVITRQPDDHLRDAVKARVKSPEGKAALQRRKTTIEILWANLKWNHDLRRFLLRGLTNTRGEFLLACIASNVWRLGRAIVSRHGTSRLMCAV
jgi:transposase